MLNSVSTQRESETDLITPSNKAISLLTSQNSIIVTILHEIRVFQNRARRGQENQLTMALPDHKFGAAVEITFPW
jgi:hypothetical protein